VAEDAWRAQLEALGAFIRARRISANLSLRQLAERSGLSNAYLSQVERGRHEPSLSVLHAIADALEVPLASLLARAGVLDDSHRGPEGPALPATERAILDDPELTEPQRIALLSVYRSFVPLRRRG